MKVPAWFWVLGSVWLLVGLPALLLGAIWDGSFSLLPDPPPYLQFPADGSFFANLLWLTALLVAYAPLVLISALAIWWWFKRSTGDSR
jgi:hypothetical protein